MNLQRVSTHELQNGDIILNYGAKLRLSDRQEHGVTAGHTEEYNGQCITFAVELIGDDCGSMPRHWLTAENPRDRYHVQGNKLAFWYKVVED